MTNHKNYNRIKNYFLPIFISAVVRSMSVWCYQEIIVNCDVICFLIPRGYALIQKSLKS